MIKRLVKVTLMFLNLMLEKYNRNECDMEELYRIAMPKIIFLRDCSSCYFRDEGATLNLINAIIEEYEKIDKRFII